MLLKKTAVPIEKKRCMDENSLTAQSVVSHVIRSVEDLNQKLLKLKPESRDLVSEKQKARHQTGLGSIN